MRDEGNRSCFTNGPQGMRQFHRIVTTNLLLNHSPTHARDDALWSAFTHHFKQCLEVTAEKEERQLHEIIFNRRRTAGEPLYGFAMGFCTAMLNYNQVSSAKISPPNDAHWLILSLSLTNYPMLELHLQLISAKDSGATTTVLIEMIANWPNLPTLTNLEKQLMQVRAPAP
jgi:hypothetical protein